LQSCTERNIGYSISGIGDINGDNISDIAIGDPNMARNLREANIIFGSSGPFPPVFDADNITGTNGFKIQGINSFAVNSQGDINGDGLADVLVDSFTGLGNVVFGQRNFSAAINVASLNGANGFSIVGASYGASLSLLTADLNGDGKGDMVIATPMQQLNVTSSVYVIFGNATFAPVFDVGSLNGTNGFRIDSTDPNRKLGVSIAAGNLNGDSFADLIIAESNKLACTGGSAYVIYGKSDFSGEHPYNLILLDGYNGYRIDGIPGCDYLGFAVSSGDVDGNGIDDVLIGSGAQTSGAEAYIVL
jgi:hypothetical protein